MRPDVHARTLAAPPEPAASQAFKTGLLPPRVLRPAAHQWGPRAVVPLSALPVCPLRSRRWKATMGEMRLHGTHLGGGGRGVVEVESREA